MTVVLNDPSLWPLINASRFYSYFIVAACVGVMYDWVMTFGQEVELIWRQRWSLMTILYLSVRYLGITYAITLILVNVPTISLTDSGCLIGTSILNWASIVLNAMLGVIMITRLHAMYQRSRMILVFLAVVFLGVNITDGVLGGMLTRGSSAEELILSGTHLCTFDTVGDLQLLVSTSWILGTVWEVLALCLALWIAVKHFRELRRLSNSAGGIIGDCFTVLMKTHVAYFATYVAVACFSLGVFSPAITANPYGLEDQVYSGVLEMFQLVQMSVLGPRLILGVREYHAELVADSDAATNMTSIAFQERVHVSTSTSV